MKIKIPYGVSLWLRYYNFKELNEKFDDYYSYKIIIRQRGRCLIMDLGNSSYGDFNFGMLVEDISRSLNKYLKDYELIYESNYLKNSKVRVTQTLNLDFADVFKKYIEKLEDVKNL